MEVEEVLQDCFIIKPRVFFDERGYFYESYNEKEFSEKCGTKYHFIQDNQSKSSAGVLRGFHFQTGQFAQSKLVRVVSGSVFDVAIDLRPDSKTFLKTYGLVLSEENKTQFLIPKGFGHAFLTLEDNTVFSYKCDNYYSKDSEGGFNWLSVDIDWPKLQIEKTVSKRDKDLPKLDDLNFVGMW